MCFIAKDVYNAASPQLCVSILVNKGMLEDWLYLLFLVYLDKYVFYVFACVSVFFLPGKLVLFIRI